MDFTVKNKRLANKAAQNRFPGFRVLSQFFLQSISRCAILLYTGHKKHPVFLLRIVSFYRCDPRPSRGLQLFPPNVTFNFTHGCDPHPSRGLQHHFLLESNHDIYDATRAPHGDKRKTACQVEGIPFLFLCDVKVECEHHVGLHQMT